MAAHTPHSYTFTFIFTVNLALHTQPPTHPDTHTCPHHQEGVAVPQRPPVVGARGWVGVLAVDGDRRGVGLAHHTAADQRADLHALHGHRGHGRVGGEPVGLVVAAGVIAGGHVAVGEGHGAEDTHAGASLACEKAGEE